MTQELNVEFSPDYRKEISTEYVITKTKELEDKIQELSSKKNEIERELKALKDKRKPLLDMLVFEFGIGDGEIGNFKFKIGHKKYDVKAYSVEYYTIKFK